MRHFWRWFCGYVCIVLNGKQINRFLNLCSRNGIHFWHVSYHVGRTVRAHISLKSLYLLRPFLKKTKTKFKILYRRGFPFWCHRHPRLKYLLVILPFSLSVFLYSYTYIWNIEIVGNNKLSTTEIETFLGEQNIKTWQKKESVDCAGLESLIRQNYNEIGWVSVYFDHTSLRIEIKESLYDTYDSMLLKDGKRYDLIANKDAHIYSVITQAGTANVKEDAFVKAGDVLVFGYYFVYDDIGEIKSMQNVYAKALIYGDVEYVYYNTLSEMEILALKICNNYSQDSVYEYMNRKSKIYLEELVDNNVVILNKKINIYKKDDGIDFSLEIKAREQIGINIPVEEDYGNELK